MQLLNFYQNQLPNASDQLLDSLQNIVSKVQIQPNFCVSHPDYKPLEFPTGVVACLKRLPNDFQNKYLSWQLRNFIYGIYYSGSLRSVLAPEANSFDQVLPQTLENNTFLGIDVEFYERLHKSNCGEGYFDPGWYVLRQESDGSLAVTKGGLTLHIEQKRHLQLVDQSSKIGDSVAVWTPRNRVQNGFYIAVSNAGPEKRDNPDNHPETVRIYFNLSPEGAVSVMGHLTRLLNEIKITFTFKVLYNPSDYGRYDSGVLYFDKINYEAVRQVLQTVYQENQLYFQIKVPLFTKFLAPGLALAEEPDYKFATRESFGMNRCQIVANGLLEAWQKGDNSPEGRMKTILQHFVLLGIDLQRSYLNANSEDIYTQLSL